jgi:hypothetical protein
MNEGYVEMLIQSIEIFDKKYKSPFFILFYLDENEEYGRSSKTYVTALATSVEPSTEIMEEIIFNHKRQLGNMIFMLDYEILTKAEAIDHLEMSIR